MNREIVSLTNRTGTITISRAQHDNKVKRNTMKVGYQHHNITIILTTELNLFWRRAALMCSVILNERPLVIEVLCHVTPIRPITNRKSEQIDIVCLLSLSLFDPLFTLLSLPHLDSARSACNICTAVNTPWLRHELEIVWLLYTYITVPIAHVHYKLLGGGGGGGGWGLR